MPHRMFLAKLLSLALIGLGACASIEDTTHDHHHPGEPAASNPGKRWLPDSSLRVGMARIQQATNDAADPKARSALASEIESSVQFMFQNCKLEPDADAALHPLLARLLGVANQLKKDPESSVPIQIVVDTLAEYRELFDDPLISD